MILPGAMLGVLGGGQLGRMFTAEARRMGYRVLVVDPDADAPAGQLADVHLIRSWTDPEALAEVAARCDAATIEFENVPADMLRALAAHIPVRPSADAVSATQNRLDEKAFLNLLGIATVGWAAVTPESDAGRAWKRVGGERALLKTARMGYDGKGQRTVRSLDDLVEAQRAFGSVPCILEEFVELETEVSIMVARTATGEITTWPIAENVHRNGVLHTSVVPAHAPRKIQDDAAAIAAQIATELDYVGVLGVECFVTVDGRLLVNELAPRPHNSGHWTLDACATSQFEQQVRCVAGLPLGDTRLLSPIAMVNLLGDLWTAGTPNWGAGLAIPGVRLHLYGKRDPRPGRKMGHLTAVAESPAAALRAATSAWEILASSSPAQSYR